MIVDKNGHEYKAEKDTNINTIYSNENPYFQNLVGQNKTNQRGIQVYDLAQIQSITGRDQNGQLLTWGVEEPLFYLSIQQRIEIARLSSPVLGIVTSRMNRLSGMKYNVSPIRKNEDKIAQQMKSLKSLYDEIKLSTDFKDLSIKAQIFSKLTMYLHELKPDLSNFNGSLNRWRTKIKFDRLDSSNEIEDWLMQPNQAQTLEEFIKEYIFDYMIHGATAIYKDVESDRIENFGLLPGGTVYRIKNPYFGGANGYVQIAPGGYKTSEALIYFDNEIVYQENIPTTARNYSLIPLEALINKVAESLLFDRLMAEQADGTKPPQKLVIITNQMPFGSLDKDQSIPLNKSEQSRIENKLNQPVKDAIVSFTGNDVQVVDLSRENTMDIQNRRQKDIKEDVALVFSASNIEMNLTGSENTSGRSTSDAQIEISQGRGIAPIAKSLENAITRGILPFRFGSGYMFEFELGKDEEAEKRIDLLALQTGEKTKNDIREKYNNAPYDDEQYNLPDGAQQQGQSELSPLFTRNV